MRDVNSVGFFVTPMKWFGGRMLQLDAQQQTLNIVYASYHVLYSVTETLWFVERVVENI